MVLLSSVTEYVLYKVGEVIADLSYVDKHMNQVGEVITQFREEFKNVQSQDRGPSGSLENRYDKICGKW